MQLNHVQACRELVTIMEPTTVAGAVFAGYLNKVIEGLLGSQDAGPHELLMLPVVWKVLCKPPPAALRCSEC